MFATKKVPITRTLTLVTGRGRLPALGSPPRACPPLPTVAPCENDMECRDWFYTSPYPDHTTEEEEQRRTVNNCQKIAIVLYMEVFLVFFLLWNLLRDAHSCSLRSPTLTVSSSCIIPLSTSIYLQRFPNTSFFPWNFFDSLILAMSNGSVLRPEVAKLMAKVMRLTQGCPHLPVATKNDKLYMVYYDPPFMESGDENDGIWFTVDSKLTATFGIDVIKNNLMQGSLGIELALKYLSRAREHPTWTGNSEELLELKLDRIAQELISKFAHFFIWWYRGLKKDEIEVWWKMMSLEMQTKQELGLLISLRKGQYPVIKTMIKVCVDVLSPVSARSISSTCM